MLRHANADRAETVLRKVITDYSGGWLLPERAAPTVDTQYVLAAAGLLADDHPVAAGALVREHITCR